MFWRDTVLGASDHERAALTQLRLLLPELIIDKGRIQDKQRWRLPFARRELLSQKLRHGIAKDRHLMSILTISLHGRQIEHKAAMQTKQVKGVGCDMTAFAIAQGMSSVFDLVTITGPHPATPQFRKGLQQIIRLALTSSDVKLPADFSEKIESATGVQGIEKGTALDLAVEDLTLLLEKVSTAANLAEVALKAQANEVTVWNAGAVADQALVIIEDILDWGQKLFDEQRKLGGRER